MMRKLYLIITFLTTWILTYCLGQNVSSLEQKQFVQKMSSIKNITLLDVRTPIEFSEGHIKGAVNNDWNGGGFQEMVVDYDKNGIYFVYCRSGHRSGLAASWMRSSGFKNVYELRGGINAWQSVGIPIE